MAKNKEKHREGNLCQFEPNVYIKKVKERERQVEPHDLEQVASSHLGFSLFFYKMSELDKKDFPQL